MKILRCRNVLCLLGGLTGLACTAHAAAPVLRAETVMPPRPVSAANASVFATPLAYRDDVVYTVNVETGSEPVPVHGLGLRTVIRRGERDAAGRWHWSSHVLDTTTPNDPYHTQASVGLDERGYVHVAYGMHYVPWQYAVSAEPDTVQSFVFRGQRMTRAQRHASQHRDVEFPGPGTAAIPGMQVTYPAFFNDRNGALYVTYRYALFPRRTWQERVFAGAIARYDVDTRQWRQLGGAVRLDRDDAALPAGRNEAYTRPFVGEPGWWAYQIRLAFDPNNGMHASWLWRIGNSGPDNTRPSYAYSPAGSDRFFRSDGSAYTLPIRLDTAEQIAPETLPALSPRGFYNPARVAVTEGGIPVVTVQALNGRRYAMRRTADGWANPERVPRDGWQIRFDDDGHEWAFASGLTVLRRDVDIDGVPVSGWQTVFDGRESTAARLCNPRVVDVPDERTFYVHANVLRDGGSCRDDRIAIVALHRSDSE